MSNNIQNQYNPDYLPPPGEILLDVLDERGMSQAELARRMGQPKKTINEIIRGKAAITPETALQLERVLRIPAGFWNNGERLYREYLAQLEERIRVEDQTYWSRYFPLEMMIAKGWVEAFSDPYQQLGELLNFFGMAEPSTWDVIWTDASVAFSDKPPRKSNRYHLSVWLRQGQIEAQDILCKHYNAKTFRETLQKVRALTVEPQELFQAELVRLCAQAGVAVVFLSQLPEVSVSAATHWFGPEKAIIQLSDRFKTDDELWFTFFHEAGHILLHSKHKFFLENAGFSGETEEEADAFATQLLFESVESATSATSATIKDFLANSQPDQYPTEQAIRAFAAELGIAPGIVVGRLQQEQHLPHTLYNELKRTLFWPE